MFQTTNQVWYAFIYLRYILLQYATSAGMKIVQDSWDLEIQCTFRYSKMAMENWPFISDFSYQNPGFLVDFPLPCFIIKGYPFSSFERDQLSPLTDRRAYAPGGQVHIGTAAQRLSLTSRGVSGLRPSDAARGFTDGWDIISYSYH